MTIQEIFVGSDMALTRVVDGIGENEWSQVMPPDFPSFAKEPQTLRQVINYHAYDEAWVPDTLAGKTIDEVGTKYDGDLLGDEPRRSWHRLVEAATQAVKACDLDRTAHLTYGDFPAREYLRHIISFRALRAVDIARVEGVSDRLPDDLARAVLDLLKPDAEALRKIGVYGPRILVSDTANAQAQLMGLTGRQP